MYLLCKKKTRKTWKANLSCRCSNKLCSFFLSPFLFSCFFFKRVLLVCYKLLRCWWEAQNDDDYYHHHDHYGKKRKKKHLKNSVRETGKKVQKNSHSGKHVYSLCKKLKWIFGYIFAKEEKAKVGMMLMFMTITMLSYVLLCWVVKGKMIIILCRVLYMDVYVFKSIQVNCMHSPRNKREKDAAISLRNAYDCRRQRVVKWAKEKRFL